MLEDNFGELLAFWDPLQPKPADYDTGLSLLIEAAEKMKEICTAPDNRSYFFTVRTNL